MSNFTQASAILNCSTCNKQWEATISAIYHPAFVQPSLLSVWRSEERVCPFCDIGNDISFGDVFALFPQGTLHIFGEVGL